MTASTLDMAFGFVAPASLPEPAASRVDKGRAAGAAVGYRLPGPPRATAGQPQPSRRHGLAQSEGLLDRDRILADQALMVAIARGDDIVFARLVGELSPRLLRFARSMLTSSPAEAEEVVQEALLRLWQKAEGWQPHGRISTWLHQVIYRLCIDNLRRRRPSVPIEAVESELEDEGLAPEDRLVRIDEVEAVQAAIARLPERQRIALLLCHFQNLSQAEASTVMALGESAYESLLARARRKLRAMLADGHGGMRGEE
jgi:RNA polymerase sigma-70 factor (ECF subfamily)